MSDKETVWWKFWAHEHKIPWWITYAKASFTFVFATENNTFLWGVKLPLTGGQMDFSSSSMWVCSTLFRQRVPATVRAERHTHQSWLHNYHNAILDKWTLTCLSHNTLIVCRIVSIFTAWRTHTCNSYSICAQEPVGLPALENSGKITMPWISFWQLEWLENNRDFISKPFQWRVGCIISFIIMWIICNLSIKCCACCHGFCLWYKQYEKTWVSHPGNCTFKLRPEMWSSLVMW